ncbi:hypothetical protein [Dyella sp. 20L07]|uniref:hypothetical protein n=1 Tax=Dyella sp. 20L07 TaxID=3384240 RepID=UPI003D2A240A
MSHPLDSLILELLGRQSAPIPSHDIARALNVPAEDVRSRLSFLIAERRARRHHYQDGVLRYTATASSKPVVVKPSDDAPAVVQAETVSTRRKKSAPLQDKVLEALKRANGELSVHGIHASLYGELSMAQISNLLQLLRQRGLVEPPHVGLRNGGWRLASEPGHVAMIPPTAPQPSPKAAPVAPVAPQPALSSPCLHDLVQQAQSATANALEAVAAMPLPSPALLKLAAANSLLAEASSIVHQGNAA